MFGLDFCLSTVNRGNTRINELVLQSLDPNPADKVLEIGFGGGYLLAKLIKRVRNGCVTGIDLSPEMKWLVQQGLDLGLPLAKVSAVFTLVVLTHFPLMTTSSRRYTQLIQFTFGQILAVILGRLLEYCLQAVL
ncbi:class I SAM-dependent methyltransferase [Pleurocapsales cyanobacterium LEGE 06147]|nr:class I SAM-dependent methyltransferase [Pleurocapsales cyanobacterium LEGE 06147]